MGEVVVSERDGHVLTLRADPIIKIAVEILDDMRAGTWLQGCEINGDLLRIRGENQAVTYRIGDPVPNEPTVYAYLLGVAGA